MSFPISKDASPKPQPAPNTNEDHTPRRQEDHGINLKKLDFNTPNHIFLQNDPSLNQDISKPNTAMTSRAQEDLQQESTTFNVVKEENSTLSNISKFRSSQINTNLYFPALSMQDSIGNPKGPAKVAQHPIQSIAEEP